MTRTLRDFVTVLQQTPAAALGEHLQRGDVSRWIIGVFGDHSLGNAVRQIEDEYRRGTAADVCAALTAVVRARYEFLDPSPNTPRQSSQPTPAPPVIPTPQMTLTPGSSIGPYEVVSKIGDGA